MKTKIGVFFGGKSVEHEVSVITAIQAIENIDKDKYEVIPIYIAKNNKLYVGKDIGNIEKYRDIPKLIKGSTQIMLVNKTDKTLLVRCDKKFYFKDIIDYINIAFPIVHGTNVEDGTLQGFLKMFNIPYVGCDVISSGVGMDKYICKCVLNDNNIPVLKCMRYNCNDYYKNCNKVIDNIEESFTYPVIVKPVNLGSSVGIKVARNKDELIFSIENAFEYSSNILVERAIVNLKEVNCSVLGDYSDCLVSECEEPIKTDEILSYKDKYVSGNKSGCNKSMNASVVKLPANVDNKLKDKIQDLAIKTFKVLGCSGVIRIDFIIDEDTNDIFVNEVNTIPGSLSFHLWNATGLDYPDLLDKLIELSLKRYREESKISYSFDVNLLSDISMKNLNGSKF